MNVVFLSCESGRSHEQYNHINNVSTVYQDQGPLTQSATIIVLSIVPHTKYFYIHLPYAGHKFS